MYKIINKTHGKIRELFCGMRSDDRLSWFILWATTFVDIFWMVTTGKSIRLQSFLVTSALVCGCTMPLFLKRYRDIPQIRHLLTSMAFAIIAGVVCSALSYLSVGVDSPLIDSYLARADNAMGFNWPKYYMWMHASHFRSLCSTLSYLSFSIQIPIALAYLSLTGNIAELAKLKLNFLLLSILTIIISVFFPAEGAAKFFYLQTHVDTSAESYFEPLRSGAVRVFDLLPPQGLVSMPSLHTITAILVCWCLRRTKAILLFLPLNILMIFSIPVEGGHYFVDMIVGSFIAFFAIFLSNKRANHNFN
jgi:membrane-associated phospholipid phosphatase